MPVKTFMKNKYKKQIILTGVGLLGIFIMASAAGFLWFQWTIKRSLPQISGTVTLAGISEKVEIIRDTYGIPHIYARNEADLYFAMGYATAQDRLWQMELLRRLGHGRLSELFGEKLVDVDRYFRMLSAGAEKEHSGYPADLSFIPRAYIQGINAYLKNRNNRLPLEFKLLRHRPEPWDVDDISAIFRVLNWGLSFGWKVDLTAADILEKVGEEKFKEAFPADYDDSDLIVPEESQIISGDAVRPAEAAQVVEQIAGILPSPASNNWVVSGKKSVTGKPLLANDTHLSLTNPSIWWEVHLVCPSVDAAGFVIPGLPAVSVGHNRHVAWGVTNVMVDDVDFYIEKLNPENPHQYRYRGQWEDMTSDRQVIEVKGKDPVEVEILITRHGPIVPGSIKISKNRAISSRWAANDVEKPLKSSYLILKAENINAVIQALRRWEAPGQNFVFADSSGNIGYWCCAAIPIRRKGNGLLPVPGWTPEYEWQGYVPFEKKPHMINPERGYIATANNKVSGNSYPFAIGNYWEPADRISRIRQLLMRKKRLSIHDIQKIQSDVYCPLAAEIVPEFIRVIKTRLTGTLAVKLQDVFEGWEYRMTANSTAACIFEMSYLKLLENIFKDELGQDLFHRYLELIIFAPRALRKMLRTNHSAWIDNVDTPDPETMENIIEQSLRQAVDQLEDTFGADMAGWTWGRLHTLTFAHTFSKRKPLNHIFNLGPYPVPGNHLTINKKQYDYTKPFNVLVGASQRMIVDMSDPAAALHVLPTGQSGLLGSPHYKDQVGLYLNGRYHPVWINRADLERHSEGTLVLEPAPIPNIS